MARKVHIKYHRANGNLHFHPHGSLDDSLAWELINKIHSLYKGQGHVFVNTRELVEILPYGSHVLKNNLDNRVVPFSRLFFKGEKGYELAPSGCRVLVRKGFPSCKCKNKCGNCGRHNGVSHLGNPECENH